MSAAGSGDWMTTDTGSTPGGSRDRQVDKYRVVAALGEGGMANVYLAVVKGPAGFNKFLVLKAIRPELALEAEHLKMFLAEARLAATLNHPNVVQTLEVSEHRGRPVIVMEYLEGQAFSNVVPRNAALMPMAMQLRIVCEALEGLEYIHELTGPDGRPLELVHRDISPHNIFVTYDGQVKLLDFGIAKSLISNDRTRTDAIKGKIKYMAPEQMAGQELDRRVDLYSIGVILWEIATKQRMWQGLSEIAAAQRVMNDEIPPPISLDPSISPKLNALILKALAREPADRFASASEIRTALEEVLDDLGTRVGRKDIGRTMTEIFATARAETRAVINAELNRKDSLRPPGSDDLFAFPENVPTLASRSASGAAVGPPSAEPQKKSRLALLLLLAAAFGGLAVALIVRAKPVTPVTRAPTPPTTSAAPTPTPSAQSTSTTSASAPAAPELVEVSMSATPASAVIFYDGDRAIGNPVVQVHPVDGKVHSVRAEAKGYVTRTEQFVLDRKISIVLPLQAVGAAWHAPTQPTSKTTSVASTAPTATAPPVATVNCNPAYYFDDQGIKHPKPGCY